MKRRKILVLIPMLGLFLSGCTFQEGFATAKSWIGEHIYHPVKDWIEEITGKKDEPTPEPTPEPEPGPEPGPGPSPVVVDYGTAEQPLSLAEFQTNVEKVIDYSSVEEGKTVTHTEAPFYIKAEVKSNEAISDGQIRFTNLIDGTVEVTGYFLSFDEGVDSAKYGVANAMLGSEIVVKGYGMIYKKMVNEQPTKVFEIGNQSKDGDKGKILSVTPPQPTPGTNYGTAEAPLTTSQAHALLAGENPSKAAMFVTGTVKSNTAWSTEYKNVDIVITDGEKDFTIFRTDKFPANFAKEAITADSLVGATVVATGTGKIYTKNNVSTYELDQGCEVLSLEFPTPTVTSVTLNTYEMALEVGKPEGQLTATVVGEHDPAQTVTWESSNPEVATVANGVVHAVAKGTTNIKAISTVDTTKESQPCVVTVTEPEVIPVLDSISVTGPTKTTYEEGETLDLTGLVVTAHYTNAPDAEVTAGWTSAPEAGAALTTSDTSLVVSYEGKNAEPVALTVSAVDPMKTAYKAGEALANNGKTENSFTFSGVVVGTRGTDDYFVQSGAYGMDVFKPGSVEGLAYGKSVTVTSKITKYSGTIETPQGEATVVVNGEASSMPNPVVIASAETLAATNQNVLVSVTGVSKTDVTTTSGNVTINLDVGGATIPVYFKANVRSVAGLSALNSVRQGDTVTVSNAVMGAYNANKQVLPVEQSTATVTPRTITSIASVAGPTEPVGLNGVIANSDVTVTVNVQGLTDPVPGFVTGITADTSTAGENLHGTATVEGWNTPVDFTFNVASDAPEYKNATMTAGTQGSACLVNNKDGIKVGTSGSDGNMTITVPNGATEVKFYAVAWKAKAGTIGVAISVGSISSDSLTLLADDGLSNNSPFTLNGEESTFAFTLTLQNVSAEATITLSSGTARRFAVWGAQYK